MKNLVVVIPALNPDEMLINYVEELKNYHFSLIVIVNDGSDRSHIPIFAELDKMEGCIVLTHEYNQGKGQALKTAFRYILENTNDEIFGVVTADADGQHAITDVYNVAEMLKKNEDRLILGSRYFNEENIPARSILGNKLTSFVFYLLFSRKLIDTQTGLRGISKTNLSWMIQLKGDRYEYEMNMLINAMKRNVAIQELKIETIYYDENSGSYYKTIIDSVRILKRIVSGFLRRPRRSKFKQGIVQRDDN